MKYNFLKNVILFHVLFIVFVFASFTSGYSESSLNDLDKFNVLHQIIDKVRADYDDNFYVFTF